MKKVYEQKSTGDLYQVVHGDTDVQVSLTGEKFVTLTHATNIVIRSTGLQASLDVKPNAYQLLNKNHAMHLVLSKEAFESNFQLRTDIKSQGNSPIQELMAEYEADRCDFSDADFLVRTALRLSDTMQDSQARCILFALANLQRKSQVDTGI